MSGTTEGMMAVKDVAPRGSRSLWYLRGHSPADSRRVRSVRVAEATRVRAGPGHECGPDPDRSADTLGQDKTLVPEDNLTKLTSNPGPDWTDIMYV